MNRTTRLPGSALHRKFSIEKGQKGWVLGRVMTESGTRDRDGRISIGGRIADFVGFLMPMEHQQRLKEVLVRS